MSLFPMQPLRLDDSGVARFIENKLVRFLLDAGPFDMNHLATIPVSNADRQQFAQLIGYSVSGFGDLSYASDESVNEADDAAAELL